MKYTFSIEFFPSYLKFSILENFNFRSTNALLIIIANLLTQRCDYVGSVFCTNEDEEKILSSE